MYIEKRKKFIVAMATQVILYAVQLGTVCSNDNCLTGGFFFATGRNMINNHALHGHVFARVTVTEPIKCFKKCQADCRCISFNYLMNVNGKNCELNEENRYTNFSALITAVVGSQYYDLTMRANVPFAKCHNGCCGSQPCLNGGTCHETCDVTGKRFTCSCGSGLTGRLCETAICFTPDWLRLQSSCFKEFTEKVTWDTAQKTCRSINSNLTSIHSAEENNFLRLQVASSSNESQVWIGLNALKNNAVYEWVDGSDVSFINWASEEPNNSNGNEHCTESNPNGYWNDVNCYSQNRSFVCGKKWIP